MPDGWRMFYSLTNSDEVNILVAILDWMNHKDYKRLSGLAKN